MELDDRLPSRRPLRLPTHDYRTPGTYFVTVCTLDKAHVLGRVASDRTILSPVGKMVEASWLYRPNVHPGVVLDLYAVMPNHFHGLIRLRSAPDGPSNLSDHSLDDVMRSFKSRTGREYRRLTGRQLWQRGYWDHVVRNDKALVAIQGYILDNPRRWAAKHS